MADPFASLNVGMPPERQSRVLFTQQQPQAPESPVADMSLFDEPSPLQSDPNVEAQYEPYKKQWYDSFAKQFGSRRFTGLQDYEAWLKTLPGGGREILPFIQKVAMQYMPPAAKEEYEMKQADRKMRQQIKMQVQQYKVQLDEMKALGLPVEASVDKGKPTLKLRNDPKEQKDKLARIKSLQSLEEKAMSEAERKYYRKQIESLIAEDDQGQGGEPSQPMVMSQQEFIQGFQTKKGRPPSQVELQRVIQAGLVQ